MGYFSTPSATPIAAEVTTLERHLKTSSDVAALETLFKLLKNCQAAPKEAKYRKLRLGNAKIAATVAAQGVEGAMAEMGWERVTDEAGEAVLVLPPARSVTTAEVRAVDQAITNAKRQCRRTAGKQPTAAAATSDPDKARLMAQLEADKKERAAAGPVLQGSTAQNIERGARITTAKDVGIGCNAGG